MNLFRENSGEKIRKKFEWYIEGFVKKQILGDFYLLVDLSNL